MFSRIEIGKYFKAEKRENFLLIALGMAAIVLAVIFFFEMKTDFYTGAGVSLLLAGALMCAMQFIQFTRNDMLHLDGLHNIEMNSSIFKTEELPRMKAAVNKLFIYRNVKVILLMAGVFLYCCSCKGFKSDFLSGFGLSLAAMSFIALVASLFAIRRGNIYLEQLESFTASR